MSSSLTLNAIILHYLVTVVIMTLGLLELTACLEMLMHLYRPSYYYLSFPF
ncbi:hypothetical protein BVRB_2g028850 [Beta vulgaris subsp. vulgaris]|nr:hypothetical protein BVRB_2g028850 [Beta vulgaris subsp. vulgaris]